MSASKEQRLAAKVNQLAQKLEKLEVAKANPVAQPGKAKKRRNRRQARAEAFGPSNFNQPNVVLPITRVELLRSVTMGAQSQLVSDYAVLFADQTTMPWLSKLTSAFGQIQWLHLEVFWKPSVGSVTNGRIIFAFDGDGKAEVSTKAQLLALSPLYDTVIWQDTQSRPLIVPRAMLKPNYVYSLDAEQNALKSPGCIKWYATGPAATELGELWVKYKVKLMNPR